MLFFTGERQDILIETEAMPEGMKMNDDNSLIFWALFSWEQTEKDSPSSLFA